MKKKVFPFLTIILMSTMSLVHAQKSNQSINSKLIEEYKTLIKAKMQAGHLVGVGAALILGDSIWKEGFGYADKENKIPFTTQTALRIGSITKPFTAMGIMQLHEKKILDVDKPLVDYLPEFSLKTRKTSIKEITVKSVIQHTSGIPNEIYQDSRDDKENYTKVVDYLKYEYQGYPVNMVFHYSNVGYCILGHTISKVSHQGYPEYIQDNILKPIGMNNSGFMDHYALKNVSKTYDSTGTYLPQKNISDIPAGCLFSTIDDMAKFAKEMIAIYNGKRGGFLKPETLKMFDKTYNDNIANINTGLGWAIYKNDSSLLIMHSGSNYLSNAVIAIDLHRKNAIVFFANTVGGLDLTNEAFEKFSTISGITSAKDQIYPYPHTINIANNISIDSIKKHAGIYFDTRDSQVVKFEKDKLILNSFYGNFELKPETNNEFLPGVIIKTDSIKWLTKSRFIFKDINGYKIMFWQDANYKRQPLAHLVTPKEITKTWKTRIGKYILQGNELEGWDKFTEAELSITKNNLLQLKIFYTSGEYLYYLRIENENELIICGFDATQGGETIRFSKEGQNDIMKLYGLSLKKIN